MEWVLGFPSFAINKSLPHNDPCMYLIQHTLEEPHMEYHSTLVTNVQGQNMFNNHVQQQSLLNLLYANRFKWQNIVMLGMTALLRVMIESKRVFLYVENLPPPAYVYASYIDWMLPFV